MSDSTLQPSDTIEAGVAGLDNGTVGDYVALLKPRVMSLVVFTALVGYTLAPGQLHPLLAFIAILAVAVGAGASGAINMWYDRDIDGFCYELCTYRYKKLRRSFYYLRTQLAAEAGANYEIARWDVGRHSQRSRSFETKGTMLPAIC